jgi:hypothetical protein
MERDISFSYLIVIEVVDLKLISYFLVLWTKLSFQEGVKEPIWTSMEITGFEEEI